jgi:Domain of unknown function (DU1801)
MTTPASGTLDDLLERLNPEVAALLRAVDDLVHRTDPDVVRVVWPHQRTMGYGVGPKKMSEHFCYVAVHKDHVNLGVGYGAELPGPEGLLQGPGKLMRHTQVNAPEDLSNPALRRLLEAASTHRMPAKPSSQEE